MSRDLIASSSISHTLRLIEVEIIRRFRPTDTMHNYTPCGLWITYILAGNRKLVLQYHGSPLLKSDCGFLCTLVFHGVVKKIGGHRTYSLTTTVGVFLITSDQVLNLKKQRTMEISGTPFTPPPTWMPLMLSSFGQWSLINYTDLLLACRLSFSRRSPAVSRPTNMKISTFGLLKLCNPTMHDIWTPSSC
jgi:hypothetical protein